METQDTSKNLTAEGLAAEQWLLAEGIPSYLEGQSQAWSVADAQGSLRPWHATRASRDMPVRMAYHGEHEGRDDHHDDAGLHTRARVAPRITYHPQSGWFEATPLKAFGGRFYP